MNLSVDVISDVICPWCYIGKRRLEKAIPAADMQVSVRWHPFQLNPTMPKEGISRREYPKIQHELETQLAMIKYLNGEYGLDSKLRMMFR